MSHVWLYPRIIASKSHETTPKYVDTAPTFYCQKLEPKVSDPKMTFDPKSVAVTCVTLPKIILFKSHENMSKYVETVTLFSKTWTKGHWPLDDLWPQVCWGHMCDSTQGPLCPSPIGIHQCMWIQWLILQNFNQDYHIPLPWEEEIRRNHNDAFFFDLSICRLIIAIDIRIHPNKDHLVQHVQ